MLQEQSSNKKKTKNSFVVRPYMEVLTDKEIEEVLSTTWDGVLCLVDQDKPYCIPIAHVYHDGGIYILFLKEGRKTRCAETNKNACYLVHCIIGNAYYSILVEGYLNRTNDETEVEVVLKKFYDNVFPKDPFFKEFRELDKFQQIVKICLGDSKVGLYKLIPQTVSGFKKHF